MASSVWDWLVREWALERVMGIEYIVDSIRD
jgi:hypothetical protein